MNIIHSQPNTFRTDKTELCLLDETLMKQSNINNCYKTFFGRAVDRICIDIAFSDNVKIFSVICRASACLLVIFVDSESPKFDEI